MSEVLGAFIGATIGSVGAVIISYMLTGRGERRKASELIVRNYLVQLQDATESLWLRVDNLVNRSARGRADSEEYFDQSSLYTLALLLAQKRRLVFDGVYGHLEHVKKGAGADLERNLEGVEAQLGDRAAGKARFLRYHRTDLAEHCLEYVDGHWRTLSFREFNENAPLLSAQTTERALGSLNSLDSQRASDLLAALDAVGQQAAELTGLPVAYAERQARLESIEDA